MALRDHPLRTIFAYAARSARRVVPLANSDEQPLCLIDISFADCIAAGEPLGVARALRMGLFSRLSPEQTISSPAGQSAMLVGRAALDISIIIDSLFAQPTSGDRRDTIIEQLDYAFSQAKSVAQTAAGRTFDNVRLVDTAFRHDDDVLNQLSSMQGQNWLGLPIDPSESGPFGKLWPGGVPDWYIQLEGDRIVPRIISGDVGEEIEPADIVCWHLNTEGRGQTWTLEQITSFVRNKVGQNNELGRAPQIFLVHAPGLPEKQKTELVMIGATVLVEPQIDNALPRSTAELVGALEQQIARGYRGWNLEGGLWQYIEGYREQSPIPDLIDRETDLERFHTEDGQRPYQSVVDASKTLDERLRSESGWPIDI